MLWPKTTLGVSFVETPFLNYPKTSFKTNGASIKLVFSVSLPAVSSGKVNYSC